VKDLNHQDSSWDLSSKLRNQTSGTSVREETEDPDTQFKAVSGFIHPKMPEFYGLYV